MVYYYCIVKLILTKDDVDFTLFEVSFFKMNLIQHKVHLRMLIMWK